MRNLKYIILAFFLFAGVASAAPYYTYQPTLLPQINNSFDLGTSTQVWRNLYVTQICLSADCKTAWPSGGSGSSFAYPFPLNATTTALLFTNGLIASASSTFSYLGTGGVAVNNGRLYNAATTTFNAPLNYASGAVTLSTAGTWSGNAVTATAFASTPTKCSAGNYPLGVDASGNAQNCTAAAGGSVSAVTGTWPIISSGGTTPNLTFGGLSTSSPISAASGLLYATGVNTIASVSTSSAVNMSITGNSGNVTGIVATANGGTGRANPGGTSAGALLEFDGINGTSVISAGAQYTTVQSTATGAGFQLDAVHLDQSAAITGRLSFSNLTQVSANSILGNNTSATADARSIATSTLYGVSTGGMVLGWNNTTGGLAFVATSSGSGNSFGYPFTTPSANVAATSSGMIFSAASSTFSGVAHFAQASTTNLEMRLYAAGFPGSDIGAQANNAYNALPANGGIIYMPCGSFSFSTAMNFSTNNKPVAVMGCGADSTTLTWTGQATSTFMNTGQSGDMDGGLRDLTLTGTSTTDIAPGIEFGGSNGYAYGRNENVHITKFGDAISAGNNFYINTFSHMLIDFNVRAFRAIYSTNSGENLTFNDGTVFADGRYAGGGSTYQKCVDLEPNVNQGMPSVNFNNVSFDKCQVYVGPEVNAFFDNDHFEELSNTSGGYAHLIIAGDTNTSASVTNSHFLHGNNAANSPQAFASTTGGNAYFTNVEVSQYSGVTLPYLNANSSSGSVTYTNIHNVAGTAYTKVELPTGSAATSILHSWFSDGVLSLGTTTVPDANSPLNVIGSTWDGSDYYQAFIGDKGTGTGPRGLSFGYDNTSNLVMLHPTIPGISALSLGIGSPYDFPHRDVFGSNGHLGFGTDDTTSVGTCGTSPLINGNDTNGTVTFGAGAVSACTITFAATFTNVPHCFTNLQPTVVPTTTVTGVKTTATTMIVWASAANLGGSKFDYFCTASSTSAAPF